MAVDRSPAFCGIIISYRYSNPRPFLLRLGAHQASPSKIWPQNQLQVRFTSMTDILTKLQLLSSSPSSLPSSLPSFVSNETISSQDVAVRGPKCSPTMKIDSYLFSGTLEQLFWCGGQELKRGFFTRSDKMVINTWHQNESGLSNFINLKIIFIISNKCSLSAAHYFRINLLQPELGSIRRPRNVRW